MAVVGTQSVTSLLGTNQCRPCPKCGQYLVEKKVKGGKQVVCINGDYEENVQK